MIVVCKKYRLIEQTKGKFAVNKMRKLLRNSVKISDTECEEYNKLSKVTGIVYEVDKTATDNRNEVIEMKPLIKQAEKLGIEVDGRWGKAKLKEEINEVLNPKTDK